jgi:hypothetical protein
MLNKTRRKTERFPLPGPEGLLDGYAIGIRWPHALRKPLEIAASDRSQSVAQFIEGAVLRALIAADLIERPRPEDL